MQLCDRLRVERERMGLTQDEMANRCGTSKRSYCAYEAGDTQPKADFLAALSVAGGDVLYVVAGRRAVGELTDEEAAMLTAFRAAPDPFRRAALAALNAGGPALNYVHGDVGVIANGPATFSAPIIKKK